MPTSSRQTPLCAYHYDPLDRLVDSLRQERAATRRYYCDKRLVTETEGAVQRSIVQHDDHLLAQQRREGTDVSSTMLATDQQRSVLNALDANQPNPLAYSPYGHRPRENGLLSLLGFNGERPDPVTGCYHLGNGYRQFNPVFMRFNSPDSWSPFGEGGVNAYTYCGGDPINRTDPTGHKGDLFKGLLNTAGRRTSRVTNQIATYQRYIDDFPKMLIESKNRISVLTKESSDLAHRIKEAGFKTDTLTTDLSPHPIKNPTPIKSPKGPIKLQRQKNTETLDTFRKIKNRNHIEKLAFARDKVAKELYFHEEFVNNYDTNLQTINNRIRVIHETNRPYSTELGFMTFIE